MLAGGNHSLPSVCLHNSQICELAIVMKYLVKAVKERIRHRNQHHIIRVSPEEHRRWTGTMRQTQRHTAEVAHGSMKGAVILDSTRLQLMCGCWGLESPVNTVSAEKNPELDGRACAVRNNVSL